MKHINHTNYIKTSITRSVVKTTLVIVSCTNALTIAQAGSRDPSLARAARPSIQDYRTGAAEGGYTYDRYARSAEAWGYPNPIYKDWATAHLQKRRLDLYAMVPFARTPNEVPAYIYSGMPLPQQDEIKAVEVELNQRYQAGDKGAELKEFWPSTRRHI